MYRTTATILSILAVTLAVSPAVAAQSNFVRPLKLGSVGEDVRALQILLNTYPESKIADVGPGSPGNESTYFGPRTAGAVVRFQERYRSSILTPNGLVRGTGYVGASTIAVLDGLSKKVVTTPAITTTPPVTLPQPAPVPSATAVSANMQGLAKSLAILDAMSARHGISKEELATLHAAVTEQVLSTTTNLKAEFVKRVQRDNPLPLPITLQDQLFKIVATFAYHFVPHEALAVSAPCQGGIVDAQDACQSQLMLCALLPASTRGPGGSCSQFADFLGNHEFPGVGSAPALPGGVLDAATAAISGVGVPFGGALDGVPLLCTCTQTWWVPLTPLPPTGVVALSYAIGSQAFLSYNIPSALWMLGFYTPGPQCLIYVGSHCHPLPVEGLMLPILGSSPI